jgi:hypothetical protein
MGALVRRAGHLHDHAYLELVEVAACHGVAGKIQFKTVNQSRSPEALSDDASEQCRNRRNHEP